MFILVIMFILISHELTMLSILNFMLGEIKALSFGLHRGLIFRIETVPHRAGVPSRQRHLLSFLREVSHIQRQGEAGRYWDSREAKGLRQFVALYFHRTRILPADMVDMQTQHRPFGQMTFEL